jgi:hypothetical protein
MIDISRRSAICRVIPIRRAFSIFIIRLLFAEGFTPAGSFHSRFPMKHIALLVPVRKTMKNNGLACFGDGKGCQMEALAR